jgi:drug/metabolite transporter (DMT)-like permease
VIFTLEPIFAAVFATLLLGEHLGLSTIGGGGLIVLALLVSEVGGTHT